MTCCQLLDSSAQKRSHVSFDIWLPIRHIPINIWYLFFFLKNKYRILDSGSFYLTAQNGEFWFIFENRCYSPHFTVYRSPPLNFCLFPLKVLAEFIKKRMRNEVTTGYHCFAIIKMLQTYCISKVFYDFFWLLLLSFLYSCIVTQIYVLTTFILLTKKCVVFVSRNWIILFYCTPLGII